MGAAGEGRGAWARRAPPRDTETPGCGVGNGATGLARGRPGEEPEAGGEAPRLGSRGAGAEPRAGPGRQHGGGGGGEPGVVAE